MPSSYPVLLPGMDARLLFLSGVSCHAGQQAWTPPGWLPDLSFGVGSSVCSWWVLLLSPDAAAVMSSVPFPTQEVILNVFCWNPYCCSQWSVLFARCCVAFCLSLAGSEMSERDSSVAHVAISARCFPSCRGAVAARDRPVPQHVLPRAGLLGQVAKSSAGSCEFSRAVAARRFFVLG
mgnify:CR=1 FL=1